MTFSRSEHFAAFQVIGQRYELLSRLREEPWGDVWLARDKVLGAEVGLKLLHREDPDWLAAPPFFVQEATLALQLRHPQVLGVFHLEREDNLLCLVQEPFPGESLLAHLTRLARFSLPHGLHLLEQVSQALTLAHDQGLAHHSLNPLNILVEAQQVRVGNFAFPRADTEQALYLELKAYDPPEVVQGDQPTPAGNVFSLGVLGFRLLAGSLPYPLTFDEPFPYRLETMPADLEEIPIPFQNLLLQCLAVEPEERFPDAGAFLEQLREVRDRWRPERRTWGERRPGKEAPGWKPRVQQAGEFAGRLWAKGKPWGDKLGQSLAAAWNKYRPEPRHLWRGAGAILLIAAIVLAGSKMRGWWASYLSKPAAVASKPAPSPVKLPTGAGGGPPMTEAEEAASSREPVRTVKPAPAAAPETAPVPTAPGEAKPSAKEERYTVIAATYDKKDTAQSLLRRLKAVNINAKLVPGKSGDKTKYQVQVGPITGAKAAQDMARRIKSREGLTPKVQKVSEKNKAGGKTKNKSGSPAKSPKGT